MKESIQWHPCEVVNGCYIRSGSLLHNGTCMILITYENHGGRYVKLVSCSNGRIKYVNGEVIAWAFAEPYEGDRLQPEDDQ